MGTHSTSDCSDQPSQVLSIYSIYIPSPIIEVKVLCTSPRDSSTILLLNKGKRLIIQDFKGRTINITLLKNKPRIISKDLKVKFYQLRDLE